MAVLHPLKVVITNYPEGQVEWLELENNPENPEMGTRKVPFTNVVYIEQDDFMENPPKKFHRLAPAQEVRLKGAYIIKCEEVIKDAEGQVVELRCTYDPDTKSGAGTSTKKVKGVLHWVSAAHAVPAEVRLYEHLLLDEAQEPEEEDESNEIITSNADFLQQINPNSMEVLNACLVEPSLADAQLGSKFQFMRHGYFCVDTKYTTANHLVFNRTVSLKDSWAKQSNPAESK